MDFRKYLDETAKELNKEVDKILNTWLKEVEQTDKKLTPLAKAFIKSNFGGKRIRGTLVRLGYEIARLASRLAAKRAQAERAIDHLPGVGKFKASEHLGGKVLKIGAAYEIFHTSVLVHDDIMDKSNTRRGNKSLYKEIGISQAITLGDFGFFLAVKIISESKFGEKEKIEALKLFSKTMMDTTIGQMLDIAHADPKLVARLKTARYTICGPLKLGAILAGANQKLLELLGQFGENLGIAFQIRDDILDGEKLDRGGQDALKYTIKAKQIIPKITSDELLRKLLEEMAEYLVERTR